MQVRNGQFPDSADSFSWQCSQQNVYDFTQSLYRRIFTACGIWYDHLDCKVVADMKLGNGRNTFAIEKLIKTKKIYSGELYPNVVETQRKYLIDSRIEIIEADATKAIFCADFIYLFRVIQPVENPLVILRRLVDNLSNIIVSFYMRTMALGLTRFITSHLPKRLLWLVSPLLAPVFMIQREGGKDWFRNAWHTVYDWFGSHAHQEYFSDPEIQHLLLVAGIDPFNILCLRKDLYRIHKGKFRMFFSNEIFSFGQATTAL